MKSNAKAAIAEQFLRLFEEYGAKTIDVDILQPANPFLDCLGEELRRRIFMTEDENGESLCLRPEFTIPVCRKYLDDFQGHRGLYGYFGEVFRQNRETTPGFNQAGIEDLGDVDEAAGDGRALAHALMTINSIKPQQKIEIVIGDQEIFDAVVKALGLPEIWQRQLIRCFGNRQRLAALIDKLKTPRRKLNLPALYRYIEQNNRKSLENLLLEEMRAADISPRSGRTPEDIARRLIENEALNNRCLAEEQYVALQKFLQIKVPLDLADRVLTEFSVECRIDLTSTLKKLRRRNAILEELGLKLANITYDAAFGRRLSYYTGIVFEISCGGALLAGGGRYNQLLTMLGAKEKVPAVGFSVWVDRLVSIE